MKLRWWVLMLPFVSACSLVESFDGYADARDELVSDGARDEVAGDDASSDDVTAPSNETSLDPDSAIVVAVDSALEISIDSAIDSGVTPPDTAPVCSADTAGDDLDCGACGVSCVASKGPLSHCVSSKCTCPSDTTDCGGVCTRLDSDPLNCGVCGRVVDGSQYCVSGTPTCRPGLQPCRGDTYSGVYEGCPFSCTDHRGDGAHCTTDPTLSTESRCWGSGADDRCVDGECWVSGKTCASMGPDRIECAATATDSSVLSCFDRQRDANHCGACGVHCKAGETCAQGKCVAYRVARACSECRGATSTCCTSLPSGWAHSTICVAGSDASTACPRP